MINASILLSFCKQLYKSILPWARITGFEICLNVELCPNLLEPFPPAIMLQNETAFEFLREIQAPCQRSCVAKLLRFPWSYSIILRCWLAVGAGYNLDVSWPKEETAHDALYWFNETDKPTDMYCLYLINPGSVGSVSILFSLFLIKYAIMSCSSATCLNSNDWSRVEFSSTTMVFSFFQMISFIARVRNQSRSIIFLSLILTFFVTSFKIDSICRLFKDRISVTTFRMRSMASTPWLFKNGRDWLKQPQMLLV